MANLLYKVCRRIIERGNAPEDMTERLKIFLAADLLTTSEYTQLMTQLTKE